jgi:hypothetical protein
MPFCSESCLKVGSFSDPDPIMPFFSESGSITLIVTVTCMHHFDVDPDPILQFLCVGIHISLGTRKVFA